MLNKKTSVSAVTLARIGVIAALYAVTTMALPFLSYGNVQLRFSEALTVLPLFYSEAVVGLFVGCIIANIIGNGFLDIILGSAASLVAAIITYIIGKKVQNKTLKMALGGLPPVFINAFVVPFTYLVITDLKELYFLNVLSVGIGQILAVYIFGSLLYIGIDKIFNKVK